MIVTALDVCGELRKLTADLKKQETAASDKREKLNRLMTLIIKDYYGGLAVSKGNGRGKTVPLRQVKPREDVEIHECTSF